jgi:hypothetical protein
MEKHWKHWRDRLFEMGMTYKEYLSSSHWKSIKIKYLKSGRPRYCLVCGTIPYSLHHITYHRLGQEHIGDLLPLCRDCHQKLHEYIKHNDIKLGKVCRIFRGLFGWSESRILEELKIFNCDDYPGKKHSRRKTKKRIEVKILTRKQRKRERNKNKAKASIVTVSKKNKLKNETRTKLTKEKLDQIRSKEKEVIKYKVTSDVSKFRERMKKKY